MLRWLTGLCLFVSAPAQAANCLPLYELEMKKLLDGTYEILHADEPDLREHAVLIGQIEARLPCADFEVKPELWSRYLVSIAIREHYQRGNWEEAITTALRLDPQVEMPVGVGHPFRSFDPAPAPPARSPLPDGVVLNKDGLPLYENVPLDALHLLQRTNGEDWETLVIHGPASIPSTWMKPPPPPASVLRARRKKGIHTVGSIASGLALAGGGTALAVGLATRVVYEDPEQPYEDKPAQMELINTTVPVGAALLSVGSVGLGVTWAIPW